MVTTPQLSPRPTSTRQLTPALLASGVEAQASPNYRAQKFRPNLLFGTPEKGGEAYRGLVSPTRTSARHSDSERAQGEAKVSTTDERKHRKHRKLALAKALTEHDLRLLGGEALLPGVDQHRVAQTSTANCSPPSVPTPSRAPPPPILLQPTSSSSLTESPSDDGRWTSTRSRLYRPWNTPISDLDEFPRTPRGIPRRFIAPRTILPLSVLRSATPTMLPTTRNQQPSPLPGSLRLQSTNPSRLTPAKTRRAHPPPLFSPHTATATSPWPPAMAGTQILERHAARTRRHGTPSSASDEEDDKLYDLYRDPIPVLTPGLERKAKRDKLARKKEREAREREQKYDEVAKNGGRETPDIDWGNGQWLGEYPQGKVWPAVDRMRDVSVERALERNRSRSGKWRKMMKFSDGEEDETETEEPALHRFTPEPSSDLGSPRPEPLINFIEATPPVAHSTLPRGLMPSARQFAIASPPPPTPTRKKPDINMRLHRSEINELQYRLQCIAGWAKGMELKLAVAGLSSEWETMKKVLEEEVNQDDNGDWGFEGWMVQVDLAEITKGGRRT